MSEKERKVFCTECRRNMTYVLQKESVSRTVKNREYRFWVTAAVCDGCGTEVGVPGLIDKNIQEIDEQYREIEGIISVEDIGRLTKLYKIGKGPLSLALGFGEVTITRYLDGQVPSKEYSDVLRRALTSPAYMKKMLFDNKEKLADSAYNKAVMAASQLENLFSVSEKMLRVISYVFKKMEEVTPLMLQKLLYFIQGIYLAIYSRPLFPEDCEAWVHGPVYPEVYELFRDFKYNPIDDARFSILDGTEDKLTMDECRVIDCVVNTFGLYGGKVLERITHDEAPWVNARKGYGENIPSNETIGKESIRTYFESIYNEYDLSTELGIKKYIQKHLGKTF